MLGIQRSPLTVSTPTDREVVMTRLFDAPRELVFRAFTETELIAQWWGSPDMETRFDSHDLRPGGQWKYVKIAPDGAEYVFSGEFQEIDPPARLVNTFHMSGMPGPGLLQTAVFEEQGNQTLMTYTTLFATLEDRDRTLGYGMEAGASAAYDQLDDLLRSLLAA